MNNSKELETLKKILSLKPNEEKEIKEFTEEACFIKAKKIANESLYEDIEDKNLRIVLIQISEMNPADETDCYNKVIKLAQNAITQPVKIELKAINEILSLDPHEEEETNEWAEAACFNKANKIANECLKTPIEDLELRLFITQIALLNPSEDSQEVNEWAESECFYKALKIAKNAINLNKKNILKI